MNISFVQWDPLNPSNQENMQQERRKDNKENLAIEMLRETNMELESLLASFGEQRKQAIALKNRTIKEF